MHLNSQPTFRGCETLLNKVVPNYCDNGRSIQRECLTRARTQMFWNRNVYNLLRVRVWPIPRKDNMGSRQAKNSRLEWMCQSWATRRTARDFEGRLGVSCEFLRFRKVKMHAVSMLEMIATSVLQNSTSERTDE